MKPPAMVRLSAHRPGTVTALIGVLALAPLLVAAPVAAQRLSVEPEAGVSLPAGQLNNLEESGPDVALHLSYAVGPRVALMAEAGYAALRGRSLDQGMQAPDMRLRSYTAGVETSLLPATRSRWSVIADGGVGATTYDTDSFTMPGSIVSMDFHHTYLTAEGGVELGYSIAPSVTAFAGGEACWSKADRQDTHVLANLDPAQIDKFDSAVTFPITIGLRARL